MNARLVIGTQRKPRLLRRGNAYRTAPKQGHEAQHFETSRPRWQHGNTTHGDFFFLKPMNAGQSLECRKRAHAQGTRPATAAGYFRRLVSPDVDEDRV